ncbi:MAG: hypothetical protein R3C56_30640 [Pirellulaceae bacterium]
MDRLLEENRNGIISPADLQVLQGLVEEAEKLMMENAKNLAATADPQLIHGYGNHRRTHSEGPSYR